MIIKIMNDIAVPKQMKKSCELSVWERRNCALEAMIISLIRLRSHCTFRFQLDSATITYTCSRHLIQFREYPTRSH